MSASEEVAAMGAIAKVLGELDGEEAKRVLRWANDRFGLKTEPRADRGQDGPEESGDDGRGPAKFSRIADLMDAATPSTGAEHVLVGAFWFQVVQDMESVTGQQVNAELKDLGHPVSDITKTFGSLMKGNPSLARQIQKSGTSRQARKKYRLTDAGIRQVQRMVEGETAE
jgi:hypothetical protein